MTLLATFRRGCQQVAALAVLSFLTVGSAGAQVPLEDTLSTLEQWVDTQRRLASERASWEIERESIRDLVALYREELEMLTKQIEESEEDVSAAESARQELLARDDRLKAVEDRVHAALAGVETRLRALRPLLPEPISQELRPLFNQLPEDSAQTERSIGQRIQYVVGLLTQIQRFNTAVTVTESIRELSEDDIIQVDTIFFGLGSAYYVDAEGTRAGYATLGEAGWSWIEDPDLAPRVRTAINIYQGRTQATYVELPVRID